MSSTSTYSSPAENLTQECLSCRIIGTGALATVGFYALNQSRRHQPGSVVGKRIMAGLGVCELYSLRGAVHKLNLTPLTGFLAASYGRWLAIRSTI